MSGVPDDIANPGSALGEAIGNLMESAIHELLRPVAEENGCIYISTGPLDARTQKRRKLLLTDSDGNSYELDAVIINRRFQPLVLFESKYIRYKKHNRDKASWICTAHTRLRQRYTTVRKSIAVLMGSWSQPSKRLLRSFEVELFEIPFQAISQVLLRHGIDFTWGEKDRQKASAGWRRYSALTSQQKTAMASELLSGIADELQEALATALDESVPRHVVAVAVVIRSSLGETFTYRFADLRQALEFMREFDEGRDMDTEGAEDLLDKLGDGPSPSS